MEVKSGASRRLRAGIVGGGRGAFIGSLHRIAAELDGQATIVAGAMSSDPVNARQSAADWCLERSYDSYDTMAREEARHPDGIDFVIVATPNYLHHPVALAFLGAGIHVICDKPLAATVGEAEDIVRAVEQGKALFALTHNYTGYPMVRQARAMVQSGALGELRKVLVEYNQDWLRTPLEYGDNKQAQWRTDPGRAGISCCVGDIGTHAENLLEFITGQRIVAMCADLSSFVEGRLLDDTLIFKPAGRPWESLRTGQRYLGTAATDATRAPAGHPEGYLEAFANIYRQFIADVRRVAQGIAPERDYPSPRDGLRGARFIEKAVQSSQRGAAWVEV